MPPYFPHQDYLIKEAHYMIKESENNMRTVDLFCGCGGMSLGFQKAGFNIVAAFDNWEHAVDIYGKNFPDHPIIKKDLQILDDDFSFIADFDPDIIIGGPPCQDFSSAGKRDENLGRGDLTVIFANIIKSIKPKFFVMENVEMITKSEKLKNAIDILKLAGYGITIKILDSSRCGVPQKRKRFFMIGELGGEDNTLLPYLESKISDKIMTVRDYMGDSLEINHYYRHPRSYKRRGVFSIDESSPTVRGVNRPIPKTYKKHPGDTADVSDNVRPLTTIERSYLQTFPKDFIFDKKKTVLEEMIGNAVPVNLGKYVAECLLDYINDKKHIQLSK